MRRGPEPLPNGPQLRHGPDHEVIYHAAQRPLTRLDARIAFVIVARCGGTSGDVMKHLGLQQRGVATRFVKQRLGLRFRGR